MSDQAIGKLIRERWPEFLVLGVVVGLGIQVFNFNREVGELRVGQTSIDSRMGRIESGIDKLDGRLEGLSGLPVAVAVLSERVNAMAIKVADGDGRRQVSHTVMSPQPGITRTINQCGTLSPKTKTGSLGQNYRWPIAGSIDPYGIKSIYAGFVDPIPGAAISARVSDDAKYFDIEVSDTGATDLAEKLQAGIDACVSVTVYDWAIGPPAPPLSPGPTP